jgi:hypothetical protein
MNFVEERLTFAVVPRTDPAFLSKFIRTKNYDTDLAFKAYVKYYHRIGENLGFIEGARPSLFRKAFLSNTIVVFKNRYQGSRIGMLRVRNFIPKEVTVKDIQMLTLMITEEYVNREPETNEKGVIVIFDLKDLSFDQLRRLNVREVRRIISIVQVRRVAFLSKVSTNMEWKWF